MSTSATYQCPCCDYFTLFERGQYFICEICFWEDSGQDLDNLDEHSGPNHQTLREARTNFQLFGACDKPSKRSVLPVAARSQFFHQPRPDVPSI